MPHTITIYQCECCKFSDTNYETVFQHEAKHFGLSAKEYSQWKELAKNVDETIDKLDHVRQHAMIPTGELQAARDAALSRLQEFETNHRLQSRTCPFLKQRRNKSSYPTSM